MSEESFDTLPELPEHIAKIIEAAILTTTAPVNLKQIARLFDNKFNLALLERLTDGLTERWHDRPYVLQKTASGYRAVTKPEFQPFLHKLRREAVTKYSRATLETLAIIAYKQPVTRGDIDKIRGVQTSGHILRTLEERGWVDLVGHKEVPGRPGLYATTKKMLDDLGLLSLTELPGLPELQAIETLDL